MFEEKSYAYLSTLKEQIESLNGKFAKYDTIEQKLTRKKQDQEAKQ